MLKKLVILFLFLASINSYASNPIQNMNNQATINIGYLPTQINNAFPF